jgi:chromate transporter
MREGAGIDTATEKVVLPSLEKLFVSFLRLGLTAFGGPAMLAHIKQMSVKHNRWLDEETFKDGIVLCQSIPGATAMQIVAYIGLKVRGVRGALASYIGFGLPAFVLMLFLSVAYTASRSLHHVAALMSGLQVIVVAIVAHATYAFGRELRRSYKSLIVAALSAVLLLRGISPFALIVGAAIAGVVLFRGVGIAPSSVVDGRPIRSVLKQVTLLVLFVIAGLAALYLFDGKLFVLSALMLKINLFAFGGGFSSIPLIFHEIVSVKGWMDSKTLMDGMALGQVTPGPIVITATFIGYLLFGFAGAIVATIAMFTPSFLVLLLAAPYFDRLKSSALFSGASKAIVASFVGLLLFVTIRFAADVPWDLTRVMLGLTALIALFRKVDILYVVLVGAVISILVF